MKNDENIVENLCDLRFSDGFLYTTTKHYAGENKLIS